MTEVSVTAHEKRLRTMPCILSGLTPVTLHHCRGGSMARLGWGVGAGQRQNPFLQIPLNGRFHVGQWGIDAGIGVETWEDMFKPQVELLTWLDELMPYDLWQLALDWHAENRTNTAPGRRP